MEFYNTEYQCMYPFIIDLMKMEEGLDITDKNDIESLYQIAYQRDLLEVFHMNEWDQNKIQDLVHQCFLFFSNSHPHHEKIINLSSHLANKVMSENPFDGFQILFSFDYFHLFHQCICQFNDEHIQQLSLKVFQ
jgi:hypothetical protein